MSDTRRRVIGSFKDHRPLQDPTTTTTGSAPATPQPPATRHALAMSLPAMHTCSWCSACCHAQDLVSSRRSWAHAFLQPCLLAVHSTELRHQKVSQISIRPYDGASSCCWRRERLWDVRQRWDNDVRKTNFYPQMFVKPKVWVRYVWCIYFYYIRNFTFASKPQHSISRYCCVH